MDKRSRRYTDEFKMLILELLHEGRSKKSLENVYGLATVMIRKWKNENVTSIRHKFQHIVRMGEP